MTEVRDAHSIPAMDHDAAPCGAVAADCVDPRLAILCREPLNAETRLDRHVGLIAPNRAFYTRNHFPLPALSAADWRLRVRGTVARPRDVTYDELCALPCHSLLVTLECAGNGRSGLQPAVEGEPWGYGAVSTAEWSGVQLAQLLEAVGVFAVTREIVVTGADGGHEPADGGTIHYARSLPLETAMHADTLLAYAMNGELLAPEQGFPSASSSLAGMGWQRSSG